MEPARGLRRELSARDLRSVCVLALSLLLLHHPLPTTLCADLVVGISVPLDAGKAQIEAALAGHDTPPGFIFTDSQHSAFSEETLAQLAGAARVRGARGRCAARATGRSPSSAWSTT